MSEFFSYDLEGLEENGVELKFKCVRMQKMSDGNIRTIRVFNTDFSEHDKVFEDKIARLEENVGYYKDSLSRVEKNCDKLYHENKELKQRIAELESKETSELPFDPLECANYLIKATYERETSSLERIIANTPDKVNSDRYTVDELEQIAEHLLVYCKHNKECEE
jgi:predicted RNase H-like nuclease (RuvC/YqgF family)